MFRVARNLLALIVLPSMGACSLDINAADDPGGTGGNAGGGGGGWNGHLIQGIDVALGGYALAVGDDTSLTFAPAIGTPEGDLFHTLPAATYDVSIGSAGMTATGHYRLLRSEDALAFDVAVDASSVGAGMSATSEFGWMLVGLQKPGAKKFKMDVRCTNVVVSASGAGQSVLSLTWDDANDVRHTFCRKSAGVPSLPEDGASSGSGEITADETGYAVFQYIDPKLLVAAPAAGATGHASVHLEIQFVPEL